MSPRLLSLAFLPLLFFGSAVAAGEGENDWLGHYVAAQEALAADDHGKAKSALSSLAAASDGELKELADAAAAAKDIQAMRTAFKLLSDHLLKTKLPKGYAVAFCPMAHNNKGASWIQKEGDIMNPYFGAAMLHCGAIQQRGGE
ncbi:MAG: DUF3347 domain-containing protein [Acidobacteria bacterium]|nr:DUF3347 domain-containing protein [Acidobacteriota bacterium]